MAFEYQQFDELIQSNPHQIDQVSHTYFEAILLRVGLNQL